jgi:hypothetical protein
MREIENNHNLLSRFAMSMPMPLSVCIFMSFLFFLYLLLDLHHLRLSRGGCRRRTRRRRADSAVEARRAFPLDPALEVVLSMTHDAATGAKPADHAGYDSENGYHCKYGDHGPHRPAARVGRVGLLGHRQRRWLLVYWSRHVSVSLTKIFWVFERFKGVGLESFFGK